MYVCVCFWARERETLNKKKHNNNPVMDGAIQIHN